HRRRGARARLSDRAGGGPALLARVRAHQPGGGRPLHAAGSADPSVRRLRLNLSAWIGAGILAGLVAVGGASPVLGTTDPAAIDPAARNRRPGAERVIK